MPPLLRARPMIARNVVVLPTPFLPKRAAHSAGFTCRLTPCRICSLPMWTCTSLRLSTGGVLDVVLILIAAEIGFTHAFVGSNFCWAPAGKDRALRHHGDVVGDLEHHLHIVFDDDDIDRARQLPNLANGTLRLGRTHPARGLVQQKQPRLGNHRHPDLEQRHVTVGERSGLTAGEAGQSDLRQCSFDRFARLPIARSSTEGVQKAAPRLSRDPAVFGDCELREDALDLKRALDAESADLVWLETSNVTALEEHTPLARLEQPRDEIE